MTEKRKETDTTPQGDASNYTLLQTMKAVAWGMLGIRKSKGHSEDFSRLNPLHLIVMGLVATLVFVVTLVAAARWFIAFLTS